MMPPVNFLVMEMILIMLAVGISSYALVYIHPTWLKFIVVVPLLSAAYQHVDRLTNYWHLLYDERDAFENLVILLLFITLILLIFMTPMNIHMVFIIGTILGCCLMLTVKMQETKMIGVKGQKPYDWFNVWIDLPITLSAFVIFLLLIKTHPIIALVLWADVVYHILEIIPVLTGL